MNPAHTAPADDLHTSKTSGNGDSVHENKAHPDRSPVAARNGRGDQTPRNTDGKNSGCSHQAVPTPSHGHQTDGDRLLTAAEIAPRLGFSVRKVWQYVRTGKLPHTRFNRRDIRFHWPTVVASLTKPGN